MSSKPLEISAVLRDTLQLYRSLFVRAFLTGFVVFSVLGAVELVLSLTDNQAAAAIAGTLTLALTSIGTTFVQGALVEAVDAEHRGVPAPEIGDLYRSSWSRLGPLIGVSLLTGIGVGLGTLLLVVPGVVLAVRWTLAAPVVMLEGLGPRAAMKRSRELVHGHGKAVFLVLLNVWIRAGIAWLAFSLTLNMLTSGALALWLGGALAAAIVTPYAAHALSVVYYRLTDPDRPVIASHKQSGWHSVWREQDATDS